MQVVGTERFLYKISKAFFFQVSLHVLVYSSCKGYDGDLNVYFTYFQLSQVLI